jgi:hypothetical protein
MLRTAVLAAVLLPSPAAADPPAPRSPLVLYITVPLCSNAQINCGSSIAGVPFDLEHNVYWGAVFGARRFFERKNSGWERVELTRGAPVFLERAVYRRRVPRDAGAPVEELVVLQAVHGDAIDQAVDHFFHMAAEGARVAFDDGGRRREEPVTVAGYAGHNRLMDGKELPAPAAGQRAPVPSFVLACASEPYFAASLRSAGSEPLVMTRTLMAPEGYLVDAIAQGLGEGLSPRALRARAVAAYARWQKLTPRAAGSIFAAR